MIRRERFPLILGLICVLALTNMAFGDKVPLVVAAVCMNAKTDKEANLSRFFSYMEEASKQGVHLIVFPETALQQNPAWGESWYQPTQQELDYVRDTAEPIPGSSTERLVDKARGLGIYVVFGMTERGEDGALYNSSVFLGPDGVIGRYRKIHLWDSSAGGNEHLIYKRGTDTVVLDSPIGKVGLMICLDMYFNQGVTLAKQGADLLVSMAAWFKESADLYDQVTRQNASLARRWHVISNQIDRVAHMPGTVYGHSRIVAPNGEVVADTGEREGMAIAETDMMIEAVVGVDHRDKMAVTWGRVKSSCLRR